MKKIILMLLIFVIVKANVQEDKNSTVELKKLEKSCVDGNATSCVNLGKFYYNDTLKTKNIDKAFELFEKACKLGKISMCTHMALTYESNLSLRYDINKSIDFHTIACKGKSAKSCERLAFFYEKGREPFTQSYSNSLEYFRKTCELEHTSCGKIAFAN